MKEFAFTYPIKVYYGEGTLEKVIAAEAGYQTEKINLRCKKISPCEVCYKCGENKTCVKNDDMARILQKMVEADVIVLAKLK